MKFRLVFSCVFVSSAVLAACGGKLHVGETDGNPKAGSGGTDDVGEAGAPSASSGGGKALGGAGGSGTAGSSATNAGSGSVAGAGGSSAGSAGTGGTSPNTAGSSPTGGTTSEPNAGKGGTTTEPEFDPVPPIAGSSDDCPEGPGMYDQECETPGSVCGYQVDESGNQNYTECACVRTVTGSVWDCYIDIGRNWICPNAAPEDGSDCFGFFKLECTYPVQKTCTCSSESGVWSCIDPPPPMDRNPPESALGERAVKELDAAERAEWCAWYASLTVAPGFPATPDRPVGPDGFVEGPGCSLQAQRPCQAALPVLSATQCAANLAVTGCEAPVSDLTACITNMYDGCSPTGDGCVDLFLAGCEGTMVTRYLGEPLGQPFSCGVRVE